MKRIFGVSKAKVPPPTLEESNARISKRGDTIDEKIRKLDAELVKYKEQIKRTRPGPAQEAIKQRALRVLKQKKMFESQRDNLFNQSYNLEQVAFASEGIKDAKETMAAMKAASKDLKKEMKTLKLSELDNLQDDMMDLMDYSNEVQESLGQSYGVPDNLDEEDLMGELDALEADMEMEKEDVPSYLRAEPPAPEVDLDLPSAPQGSENQVYPERERHAPQPLRQ